MRNFDELAEYCLSLPGAVLEYPFDNRTPVFKTGGKMFCLAALDSDPLRINLKCDPELSPALRDSFPAVTPGYHMNKVHWNSIRLDGTLPDDQIRWLISHSHGLVSKLKRKTMASRDPDTL